MANIFDKFLDSMKLYEDEETEEEQQTEEEESVYLDDEEEEEEKEKEKTSIFSRVNRKAAYQEEQEEEPKEEKSTARSLFGTSKKNSNVTPMRSSGSGRSQATMEVSLIRPTTMDDARDISDMLLSGRAVVINMEGVQVDLAQRIIDFSSGACYSIDGNLQRISSYIFIITPSNIELSGDFQNALSGSDAFGVDR